METYDRPGNRFNPTGSSVYLFVFTTYRLTEHHTAGDEPHPRLPVRAQPEMFCEVSPALARPGGWSTAAGRRSSPPGPRSRPVLVTDRMRPAGRRPGRPPGRPALPLGRNGLATGDGANDLLPIVGDPNVHIMESKANTATSSPAAAPAGRPGRLAEGHRARAAPRRADDRADGVLHRHSVGCIGCKACEVACKEWNLVPRTGRCGSPATPTTTPGPAPALGATSPSRSSSTTTRGCAG